jgi:hypothetical protein
MMGVTRAADGRCRVGWPCIGVTGTTPVRGFSSPRASVSSQNPAAVLRKVPTVMVLTDHTLARIR